MGDEFPGGLGQIWDGILPSRQDHLTVYPQGWGPPPVTGGHWPGPVSAGPPSSPCQFSADSGPRRWGWGREAAGVAGVGDGTGAEPPGCGRGEPSIRRSDAGRWKTVFGAAGALGCGAGGRGCSVGAASLASGSRPLPGFHAVTGSSHNLKLPLLL